MVNLSIQFFGPFLFYCVLFCLFLLLVLLIVRWVISMKAPQKFSKIKIWHILLVVPITVTVIFLSWFYIIKISSEIEISRVLESLKTCDKLELSFSYPDPNNKYAKQDIQIDDKTKINKLFILLKNRSYVLVSSEGVLTTTDFIKVVAYKDREKLCQFWIILDLLEIGEESDFSRYECSDGDLTFNVRRELGLPGWD
jgi:hypothetical protein